MELRNVGTSGLKVSTLGIGCNNFGHGSRRLDYTKSAAVVHAALDHGVTHFDTADVYPMGDGSTSEEYLGKALGSRRAGAVIASKFGMQMKAGHGGSRRYIMQAVEASLKRLNTDWIDLLYFHTPDPDTPIDETLRALDDLISSGKVNYVASSNFAPWQTVEAHFIARELGANRFIATQEHYSLLSRTVEAETIPLCQKFGIGLVPFFPLASGVLSGKFKIGEPIPSGTRLSNANPSTDKFLNDKNLKLAVKFTEVAQAQDKELIDLAFAWLLRDKVVPSVIAGASTPEQVARNAEAVAWQMSDEQVAATAKVVG
ncbi:MAG: aldo/keto reductase [Rhizobiaceae bacterium]